MTTRNEWLTDAEQPVCLSVWVDIFYIRSRFEVMKRGKSKCDNYVKNARSLNYIKDSYGTVLYLREISNNTNNNALKPADEICVAVKNPMPYHISLPVNAHMHTNTDRHLFLGIVYITASSPACERNTDANRHERWKSSPPNLSYFPEESAQFPPSDCLVCWRFICFFLHSGQCPSAL